MSVAEKIVWLFEHRVTEAHRGAIEQPLDLTPEQFDQAIPRARDLGVERGIRLTAIYERDGWWTGYPTQRIAARYIDEASRRNVGEAERNARVYAGFGKVGEVAAKADGATHGARAIVLHDLPERLITEGSDYVVERVDLALEARRGYVAQPVEAAQAA